MVLYKFTKIQILFYDFIPFFSFKLPTDLFNFIGITSIFNLVSERELVRTTFLFFS